MVDLCANLGIGRLGVGKEFGIARPGAIALPAEATESIREIASAGERPPLRLALAMLLLGLTRPAGNLVAVTCALTVLVMLPRAARGRFAHALLWGYLLPGMVYVTWRWTYYGQPLPLPFYVKVASPTALPGTSRVLGFVAALALPAGVCAMLGLVRLPRLLRPALVAATTLLLFGLFPNHLMGYQLRYLVPAAPLLFVIAGLGAARLSAAFTQLPRQTRLGRLSAPPA